MSLGWYQKWKHRHCISLRTKTILAQASPERFRRTNSEVPSVCHSSTSALRILIGRDLQHGWDTNAVRASVQPYLEFGGSRTVPVESCYAEKRSFAVTLAVAADERNCHRQWSSRECEHLETLLCQIPSEFLFIKKDGRMKLVSLSFCLALFKWEYPEAFTGCAVSCVLITNKQFLFSFLFSTIEGRELGRTRGCLESCQHSTQHQEGIFKLLKEGTRAPFFP